MAATADAVLILPSAAEVRAAVTAVEGSLAFLRGLAAALERVERQVARQVEAGPPAKPG